MMGFQNLSPRERGLIWLGGGLFILFAFWQFAIKPILSAKGNAQSQLTTAQRDLSIVQNGVGKLRPEAGGVAKRPFDGPQLVAIAQAEGLTISRTQPDRTDGLTLWFENATAERVYTFLNLADTQFQMEIRRAQINRGVDGTVDAQITLGPQE